MTKSQLINHALELAEQTAVDSSLQENYEATFNLYYSDFIKKRPWGFAHSIVTNLQTTNDGADLGYKYKYSLGNIDAEEVLDINFQDRGLNVNRFRSREEALDFGYTLPDDAILGANDTKNFIYISGVLHSDTVVTKALIKKQVDITALTPESTILFATILAKVFAKTITRKQDVITRLERDELDAWVNATRKENQEAQNPQLRGVFEWLNAYYSQTRANRNFT